MTVFYALSGDPAFLGIEHLCAGTCKAVNFIGQGLCNVLDVAVGALKVAEAVVGWVNAAIQFVMQMFLIHGFGFISFFLLSPVTFAADLQAFCAS